MTAVLEPVAQVPGQLPLPKVPSERALTRHRPVARPDGRLYRPRHAPEALVLGSEDEVTGVAVMRTHHTTLAYRLAVRALEDEIPGAEWTLGAPELRWGHWRTVATTGSRIWVPSFQGRTGTPAVFFYAVTR